ncbi:sugar ABC transporter substrate-binding protein [Candidatus Aerophobetes bacterium]|nr:sugar ABC transporter substrate-binding protein [Candidatus Aerophobetes bacterium]
MLGKKIVVMSLVALLVLWGSSSVFAGLRIGYTPPTLDKADFMGQFEEGMIGRLDEWSKETGNEYTLYSRSPADHAAHHVQLQIVEDFLTIGVDYIVVIPTGYEIQRGAYRAINEEGVPLIIGNYSDPFPKEWGVHAIKFVGYSHADGGQAVVDYIAGRYPPGTKMAIIYGEAGKVSRERGAKEQHLANGFNVIYEDYADWDRVKAYDATERLLTAYPDVKVIIACSSAMAIGAIEAVEAAGLTGRIHIYGAGATIEELDAILRGRMIAAWFRDPIAIGRAAAEGIIKHYEGRQDEISYSWNVPIIMVDSYESIVKHINPITFTSMGRPWPPDIPK